MTAADDPMPFKPDWSKVVTVPERTRPMSEVRATADDFVNGPTYFYMDGTGEHVPLRP